MELENDIWNMYCNGRKYATKPISNDTTLVIIVGISKFNLNFKNITDCNKLVSNSLASDLPVIQESMDLSLASFSLPQSLCLCIVFSSYHLVTFGYNHPKWSHDCLSMDPRRDTICTYILNSKVGNPRIDGPLN